MKKYISIDSAFLALLELEEKLKNRILFLLSQRGDEANAKEIYEELKQEEARKTKVLETLTLNQCTCTDPEIFKPLNLDNKFRNFEEFLSFLEELQNDRPFNLIGEHLFLARFIPT